MRLLVVGLADVGSHVVGSQSFKRERFMFGRSSPGGNRGDGYQRQFRFTPELLLTLSMLVLLTALLLVVVLWMPFAPPVDGLTTKPTVQDWQALLAHRKDLVALLLTAFGAWVGAGAAYFFGKESLREATNSLIRSQQASGAERLRQMTLSQLPVRPIPFGAKRADKLGEVAPKLRADVNKLWFITVVDEAAKLDTIVHKEVVMWYVMAQGGEAAAADKTVDDAIKYAEGQGTLKPLLGNYVTGKVTDSAADAYERMEKKGVYLIVLVDDQNKPLGFIDSGDIRRALLQ
jgi:hypothetical protein